MRRLQVTGAAVATDEATREAGRVRCSACRGGLGSGSSARCALQCARVPRGGGSSERGNVTGTRLLGKEDPRTGGEPLAAGQQVLDSIV